jgi:hypothetical protein
MAVAVDGTDADAAVASAVEPPSPALEGVGGPPGTFLRTLCATDSRWPGRGISRPAARNAVSAYPGPFGPFSLDFLCVQKEGARYGL